MTMNFKSEMRELMTKAWQLVRENNFTMAEAMRQMWQIMKLKRRMKSGVVQFFYKKIDGTTRTAFGSLCSTMIPATAGTRRPSNGVTTYYDYERNAYRCFKNANYIGTTL